MLDEKSNPADSNTIECFLCRLLSNSDICLCISLYFVSHSSAIIRILVEQLYFFIILKYYVAAEFPFNIKSMEQTRKVSTNIFLEPAKFFFMPLHELNILFSAQKKLGIRSYRSAQLALLPNWM